MGDPTTSTGRVPGAGPVKPVSSHEEKGGATKSTGPIQGALSRFRPLLDAYRAKANPAEHLQKMRQVVFRIGIKHKVSALADQVQKRLQPTGPQRTQKSHEGGIIREGRLITIPNPKSVEKEQAPATGKKQELNPFEKIFMAHFEGEIPLGEALPPGQQKFLKKSEEAWTQFFQRFLPFAQDKTVSLKEIQMLIFRGLVKQGLISGNDPKFPVLVSDLKLVSGKTERYARISIQSQEFLNELAHMMPGDVIARDAFSKVMEKLGLADLVYQLLSHRVVNPEMLDKNKGPLGEAYQSPEKMRELAIREGVREETQGMALSRRTEDLIAKRLEIDLRRSSDQTHESRERIVDVQQPGLFSGLFSKKRRRGSGWGGDEDSPQIFVPWYQQIIPFQKHKGKIRWWVPLIYFVTASAVALSIGYIMKYLVAR